MYGPELLESYTRFVTIVNDFDMWIHKYKGSMSLNIIFGHLQFDKFKHRFADGQLTFNSEEKAFLTERPIRFKKFFEDLVVYESTKINACYVIDVGEFFNDVSEALFADGYKIVFIIGRYNNVSIRTRLDDLNVGVVLKSLGFGGGHTQSGGITSTSEDHMQERMDIIEDEFYNICESCRN